MLCVLISDIKQHEASCLKFVNIWRCFSLFSGFFFKLQWFFTFTPVVFISKG